VIRIQKDGYSRYNGLQAKIEKRYSKGVTFIASYAWSKTMALGETTNLQNPLNWAAERAVSAQDMTQHFVGSAVYELPFGRRKQYGAHWNRGVDAVLGGWSVGPIVTVDTGLPLNLSVNGTPSNSGQADRPNVVGDWHLANHSVQEWFNTAAFAKNALYTYGNAGRNVLRGPGLFNLDLAAHKVFRFNERTASAGVFQRDEHAGAGQSQHNRGQPALRPDFLGRNAKGQPNRVKDFVLKGDNHETSISFVSFYRQFFGGSDGIGSSRLFSRIRRSETDHS
jgi:hypothetical protein